MLQITFFTFCVMKLAVFSFQDVLTKVFFYTPCHPWPYGEWVPPPPPLNFSKYSQALYFDEMFKNSHNIAPPPAPSHILTHPAPLLDPTAMYAPCTLCMLNFLGGEMGWHVTRPDFVVHCAAAQNECWWHDATSQKINMDSHPYDKARRISHRLGSK